MKKLFKSFNWYLIIIMLCLAGLILNFTVIPVYAVGSTYYVSKTGSDLTGTGSIGNPFLTIQKGLNTATTAGDTVVVKAGTYTESLSFQASGSGSDYITLKNYGSDKVIVDGTGLNPANAIISAFARHHIVIDGLEIQNSPGDSGIYIGTYAAGSTGYYIIKNCIIHNTWGSGIQIVASWAIPITDKISNVIIDNCEVYDTNIGGDQEAISLVGVNTFEIKNCTVYDILGHDHYTNDKEGIDCKEGTTNGSIHGNEIYNAQVGIYIDGASTTGESNIDIYNNNVHDCYITGIGIGSEGTHQDVTGIDVYNNLIYDNDVNGFSVYANAFNCTFTLINNTFYNNTSRQIYTTTNPIYSSSIIRNNIVFSNAGSSNLLLYQEDTGITIDHNLFYNTAYNASDDYGSDYIQANPLFISPPSNFQISSLSPAKNIGSTTGAPATDYNGESRGAFVDIGAYEYQNTVYGFFEGLLTTFNNLTSSLTYPQILASLNNTQLINNGYCRSDQLDVAIKTTAGTSLPMMPMANNGTWFTSPNIAASSYTSFIWSSDNAAKSAHQILVGNGGFVTTPDNADLEPHDSFELTISAYLSKTGTIFDKHDAWKLSWNSGTEVLTLYIGTDGAPTYTLTAAGVAAGEHLIRIDITEPTLHLFEHQSGDVDVHTNWRFASTWQVGASFDAESTHDVTKFRAKLRRTGTGVGNMTLTMTNGFPNDPILTTSAAVDSSVITTDFDGEYVEFTLNVAQTMTNTNRYSFYISSTLSDGTVNYMEWLTTDTPAHPAVDDKAYTTVGGGWAGYEDRMLFQVVGGYTVYPDINLYVDDMFSPIDSENVTSAIPDNSENWIWYSDPYWNYVTLDTSN